MSPVGRFALALLAASACGEGEADHAHDAEEHGRPNLSFTHYSPRTEAFVETPALVVGLDSPFAVHLTVLDGWRPLAEGSVTVLLAGAGGIEERFSGGPSAAAGIFRPVVRPRTPGACRLVVVHESGSGRDEHELGDVVVHASEAAAKRAAEAEPAAPTIPFLLEQQWRVDFEVRTAEVASLRDGAAASGVLRAVPELEGIVSAPVPGRVVPWSGTLPRLGDDVRRGALLAALVPSPTGTDAATIDLEVSRAEIETERARVDRERAEALLAEGAVPERRALDARTVEETARAALRAARTRRAALGGVAPGARAGRIALRAPVAGRLVEVDVTPGAFVEAGREVFHVVDLSRLWLEARIPEADLGRVREATGATFEVDGLEETFSATPENGARIVALGGRVDPQSRTVPLVLELSNPSSVLRIGMAVRARVLTGRTVTGIAIPTTAVVRDGGMDVAFVQIEGEAFERRILRLGIRDGDRVEVREGLREGERVVTKGAWYVRLAASAGAVPAHGHVH